MKARNPSTGNLETVYVKALDSMPVGTIVDYEGQASDIPTGWETYGTGQIKKTSETRPLAGHIVNAYDSSQNSAYATEYINNMNTYSTEEQVIGTWVNGKPIYRKVLRSNTSQSLSSRTSSIVLGNISNIEDVIDLRVYASTGGGTNTLVSMVSNHTWAANIFSVNNANTFYTTINTSNGNISLNRQAGSSLDATTTLNRYVCIIEYTKTTD